MFSMCIYSSCTTYCNNPMGWGKVLQSLSNEETKAQGSKQFMHKDTVDHGTRDSGSWGSASPATTGSPPLPLPLPLLMSSLCPTYSLASK